MIDNEFIDLQEALAGEYSLERELGRGGMGIVYLAREVQLDRLVAIKVLPATLAERHDIRERFLREARTSASLSHPNIVPIYRVGERSGFVFFVMAYVHGETLGERIRRSGPLAPAIVTRLVREVAWALAYAHGRGIVHRDVKPDNILIEAGTERALVSDFGIALGREGDVGTVAGQVMGTLRYMSPEQAAGEPLDGRSDLYALGVVAHLALTGVLPRLADGPGIKELERSAPSAALPGPLSAIVGRCLRQSPADRWASGEELAEALDRAAAPARTRMPMALRVWTRASDPLKPAYLLWSSIFTMGTLSEMHRGGDWLVTIGFGLLPALPAAVFHARKSYQALAAGYGLGDLRRALREWQTERREELSFEHGEHEALWKRVLRAVTLSMGSAVAASIWYANGHHVPRALAITFASLGLATAGAAAASSAMGVPFLPKRIRTGLVGAVQSLIWNSRVGELAAKLLAPKHRRALPDADFRPTEMALGVAAEELFATLPKSYREHLRDLPRVVAGLEAHAAAARARIEELAALSALGSQAHRDAGAEPTEVGATRSAAERDLAAAVTALEAIRLDLLRLHARDADADLQPMTTSLDAGRRLTAELGALNAARREANAIAPVKLEITPPTPA
jgi:eukaryotic-like serine/threonine-protein kinase